MSSFVLRENLIKNHVVAVQAFFFFFFFLKRGVDFVRCTPSPSPHPPTAPQPSSRLFPRPCKYELEQLLGGLKSDGTAV